MILNAHRRKVAALLFFVLSGLKALAYADNNVKYSRAQTQRVQAGYRPVGVGYQQPFAHNQTQWQRANSTQGQSYNIYNQQQKHNQNRTQYNQPGYRPAISNPQQYIYGQERINQTRSSQQKPQVSNNLPYPGYRQQGSFNHTLSTGTGHPQHSLGSFNQTRPSLMLPNYPQYPSNEKQGSLKQTHPLPVYPNLSQNKSALPSNSWTPLANQTNLYPKLPGEISPQPSVGNKTLQASHNLHADSPAMLSYGQGHYLQPARIPNKYPPANPYVNIFN